MTYGFWLWLLLLLLLLLLSVPMSMPVSVLYLCLCPGMCGFAGSICYVSTHFRYILTILVLIRNTFFACHRKLVKYCFIRQSCQKTNWQAGQFRLILWCKLALLIFYGAQAYGEALRVERSKEQLKSIYAYKVWHWVF